MAVDPRLYEELAQALGQPSRAYRAVSAALDVPRAGIEGYLYGTKAGADIRQDRLKQQTLADALGGKPLEEGIMGLTGESGAAQHTNIADLIALDKAKKEAGKKGMQLFGIRGNKGLTYNPNENSISEIPLPPSDEPILPRAVSPSLSPYATPGGQPEIYTPGKGLSPVASTGGGTPVLKQGNEQAISDVALMQSQAPNINKLFDAYKLKSPAMSKIQATPAGSVIDPATKQLENSLKLAAFTFGGKNLTSNEKDVVFGAFFPSVTDNDQSREQKRNLLKDYFAGKIDLLQAANLLGPAGATLKGMLQAKQSQAFQGKTFATEQEAEASGYKGPAIINGKRAIIH